MDTPSSAHAGLSPAGPGVLTTATTDQLLTPTFPVWEHVLSHKHRGAGESNISRVRLTHKRGQMLVIQRIHPVVPCEPIMALHGTVSSTSDLITESSNCATIPSLP